MKVPWARLCRTILLIAGAIAGLLSATGIHADEDDTAARMTQALIGVASDYRIVLQDDTDPLQFRREPLLVWVNPVRHAQQGVVHVWTRDGRARAIGSIFANTLDDGTKQIVHELHSLAPSGLTATLPKLGDVWHPTKPGLPLSVLEEAPAPADSAPGRLLQMRRLGREFSGHSVDFEGGRWQLRLLPQPLYRYETGDDIHDGAVFSMVSNAGTDPEILLVFEVRDTGNGPRWHYAAARFSDLRLYLDHKGKRVWQFEAPDGVVSYSFQASEVDAYRLFVERSMTRAEAELFLQSAAPGANDANSKNRD
ncbi:MAG: hypothetical protein R3C19_12055 [Planctomycetaceae bacterium]